ncbi:MAG TPA: helix-turn-helix domain-containing protein [Streptosporangiaceae bacterium]|nr:helix-turn-helix domain-containing protein [Streptosporangiaceae bacterium]
MNSEQGPCAAALGTPRVPESVLNEATTGPVPADPAIGPAADPALGWPAADPAADLAVGPAADLAIGPAAGPEARLPVMPGFREMAVRRRADEQAARMAQDRGRLVRQLAEQRQASGLSQTEVAARMGTSQSAVARLESGTGDVRASTLERYAAAVGGQITWKFDRPTEAEGTSE